MNNNSSTRPPQTQEEIAQTVRAFGMTNPRYARITKDVKTKLGLAFKKGDSQIIYEGGLIETGPYAGQVSYSAFSIRNNVMTALRPSHFKFYSAK